MNETNEHEGREEKPIKLLFGLESQGHIKTIERILSEHGWSNDYIWGLIGKEIGWAPSTACAFYVTNLREQLAKERALRTKMENGIKKFIHHWNKYFYSPKVGQPPSLEDLENLIQKSKSLDEKK